MKKYYVAMVVVIVTFASIGLGLFSIKNRAFAEQLGSSPESGVTSNIAALYDDLVTLGFGSDTDTPSWGTFWNRIKTAAKWTPSGDANATEVLTGKTFYKNARSQSTGTMVDNEGDNASTAQAESTGVNFFTAPVGYYDGGDRVSATDAQIVALSANLLGLNIKEGSTIFGVAGSYPAPSSCSTQAYHDNHASANPTDNCSNTWQADTSVTGAEKLDPVTGLIWSNLLINNAGTVAFSVGSNSTWSWDGITDADNVAVGGKTASQLCSERGDSWRLPTQKELMQAYIDGSYWNLTQPAYSFWSATVYSGTIAWRVYLHDGSTTSPNKTSSYQVRCVR